MNFFSIKSKELEIIANNQQIKDEQHSKTDYANLVCKKPWGYEFLVYESNKIAIWYLKMKENHSTSLHAHFKKDTLLFVLSGTGKLTFVDNHVIELCPMQSIFIPRYKFHALSSFSPDTIFLEIEIFYPELSFSDKNDLLRIDDQYKRKKTGYEASVDLVSDALEEYNYFYLNNQFQDTIESTDFKIWNLTQDTAATLLSFKNSILLEGEVRTGLTCLKEGSILTNLHDTSFVCTAPTKVLSFRTIDSEEDSKLIYSIDHLLFKIRLLKNMSKKIILTSGCFDILHVGHLSNLKRAKEMGDILMVCLSNDDQIRKLKGADRPINCYQDRIDLFKTIPYVDYIILYDEKNIQSEETLGTIMKVVDPDIWVKGTDYTKECIFDKHPYLKRIELIPNIKQKSTTNIIRKIKT